MDSGRRRERYYFRDAQGLGVDFVMPAEVTPGTATESALLRSHENNSLAAVAGQGGRAGTFIGRILHDILYYDLPPWVFVVAYVSFALLVAATLVVVPPQWRRLPKRGPPSPA